MSILDKKKMGKTSLAYIGISIFCILFDNIYALFGHGVRSPAMSYMFLYPLVSAVIFAILFFINSWLKKEYRFFRASYNLYNIGIACLTIGSMLQGIFEIAGTNSKFLIWYYCMGIIFVFLAVVLFIPRKKNLLLQK